MACMELYGAKSILAYMGKMIPIYRNRIHLSECEKECVCAYVCMYKCVCGWAYQKGGGALPIDRYPLLYYHPLLLGCSSLGSYFFITLNFGGFQTTEIQI